MRKKAVTAKLTIAILVLAVLQIEFTTANFINFPPMPPITITVNAPQNGSTYGDTMPYAFLTQMESWNGGGTLEQVVTVLLDGNVAYTYSQIGAYRTGVLTELTNGLHYVEIRASSYSWAWKDYQSTASSGRIYFTVTGSNVVNPMDVRIVFANFQANSALFNFTTKGFASWISYSIDSEGEVTITDDVIISSWYGLHSYHYEISNLDSGKHNVTFYAKDEAGHIGQSNPYSFTIQETLPRPTPLLPYPPSASPSPSPSATQKPTIEPTQKATPTNYDNQTLDLTPILALSGVVMVAVAVGVTALAYLKRRRKL